MKFHKIIQKISTGLFRRAALHSPFSILHSARNGFTLIELIVVLGITAFLSSIMISYNHTSRQQLALYAEETKLMAHLPLLIHPHPKRVLLPRSSRLLAHS